MSLDITLRLPDKEQPVWNGNITHNLGPMANYVGLYDILWRPEEHKIYAAGQVSTRLMAGISALVLYEDHLRTNYTPSNGWGSYEGLLDFCLEYLEASLRYPDANVEVSR